MGIVARAIVSLSFVLFLPLSLYAANSQLTVAGGATLTLGNNISIHTGGNLNIGSASSAATLVCKAAGAVTNTRIVIDASGNMTIFAGSLVQSDGTGYAAQYGPLSLTDYTNTINNSTSYAGQNFTGLNSSGGGGGHGGAGGNGNNGGNGGLLYGGGASPISMGSGGGRGQGTSGQYAAGGAGGGAIQINIGGTIVITGDIRANGSNGSTIGGVAGGGGGAGGSITITTVGISGTGCLHADGGAGGANGGGGGAGGRITISYFTGTIPACITVTGGTGGAPGANGANGVISQPSAPPSNLVGTPATTTITWTWNDNSSNETGFVVHDQNHAVITTLAANTTLWQEINLSENVSYNRHVHALMGTSESAPTNSSLPYTLVHNPTTGDFALTPLSSWQIQIVITAPPNGTTGQTGARIEQSLDNSQFDIISDFSQTYTIVSQPLLAGVTYYYRVTFRNGDGVATAISPSSNTTTLSVPVPVITTPNKKTNDGTPLVEGTGESNLIVELYEGTTILGSTSVSNGTWQVSSSSLSETAHNIHSRAVDGGQNGSGNSNVIVITIDITPPSAPQELHATATNGMVMLEWNANTETDLLGYNIYRKAPGEQNFTKINPQVVVVASFCDTAVINDRIYEYRVTSVDNTTIEQ